MIDLIDSLNVESIDLIRLWSQPPAALGDRLLQLARVAARLLKPVTRTSASGSPHCLRGDDPDVWCERRRNATPLGGNDPDAQN